MLLYLKNKFSFAQKRYVFQEAPKAFIPQEAEVQAQAPKNEPSFLEKQITNNRREFDFDRVSDNNLSRILGMKNQLQSASKDAQNLVWDTTSKMKERVQTIKILSQKIDETASSHIIDLDSHEKVLSLHALTDDDLNFLRANKIIFARIEFRNGYGQTSVTIDKDELMERLNDLPLQSRFADGTSYDTTVKNFNPDDFTNKFYSKENVHRTEVQLVVNKIGPFLTTAIAKKAISEKELYSSFGKDITESFLSQSFSKDPEFEKMSDVSLKRHLNYF
jgi:hypothetical protein